MNDRQLEELLRDSWRPEPPNGMRERVLKAASAALLRRPLFPKWQLAFAGIGLLLILASGVSDACRSSRLAALQDGGVQSPFVVTAKAETMMSWRADLLGDDNSTEAERTR